MSYLELPLIDTYSLNKNESSRNDSSLPGLEENRKSGKEASVNEMTAVQVKDVLDPSLQEKLNELARLNELTQPAPALLQNSEDILGRTSEFEDQELDLRSEMQSVNDELSQLMRRKAWLLSQGAQVVNE